MPWVSLTVRRTDWPVAAIELAHVQILDRHAALDHARLEDVDQRVHPEFVVGRESNLGLGTVELDGAVGALEVVALGDLLQRLIDGVVDLLQVGAGRYVERGIAGHGVVARGWKTGRCRRMREGLPGAPRLTTLRAALVSPSRRPTLGPLAPAGALRWSGTRTNELKRRMHALRAHQAGGRRVWPPDTERELLTAASRDVLSNDALLPLSGVDGVIGACARKRRGLTSATRHPRPGPLHRAVRAFIVFPHSRSAACLTSPTRWRFTPGRRRTRPPTRAPCRSTRRRATCSTTRSTPPTSSASECSATSTPAS